MTIDGLRDLLSVWRLDAKGRSLPEPNDFVRMRIAALCPDEEAGQLFRELKRNGWIEILVNGDWTLTAKGLAARPADNGAPVATEESDADREAAWTKFRVLCEYYADCVQLQEKEAEILFDNQCNTRFFLPALPLGWLTDERKFRLPASSAQQVALRYVANGAGEEKQAFIGYPLAPFSTSTGNRAWAPLMLLPVDISRDASGTWAEIQREGIDINQKWLRFRLPPDELQPAMRAFAFTDGERRGEVDPEAALAFFANRFRTELDPDNLDFDLWKRNQLLNAAAFFLEDELKYSKTLKKELHRIKNASAKELDRTALAYVFRDPPLPNRNEGREDVAFDFIAANGEQHEAVDEALNRPATKVTGPPGTGKSQVAVNLIANLLIRGQSVLFTSKNHKAIHAIRDKVDAVGKEELPLVQFCSQSDGGTGAVWYAQDIDSQIGRLLRAQAGLHGIGEGAVVTMEDAANRWRDRKPHIRAREKLLGDVAAMESKREAYAERLKRDGVRPSEELLRKLERTLREWETAEKARTARLSWWRRLLAFLRRQSAKSESARARLEALLPGCFDEFSSDETIRATSTRVVENLAGFLREEARRKELEKRSESLPDYGKMLETLGTAYRDIRGVQEAALVERLAERAAEADGDAIQKLRNATARLKSANQHFFAEWADPEENAAAEEAFRGYAKIFPAWACTLLSLHKAAPCIPGLFNRVIIDEASQCEIPPIIPALYRARGVTVIGDPLQFRPVVTLHEMRNLQLRIAKYGLGRMDDERFDFRTGTAYSIVPAGPVGLREHFRCHADIADYCNDAFYQDRLHVRTDESKLVFPAAEGFRAGRVWRNVVDSLEGELAETEKIFVELAASDFQGSVGVVTPFREIAERLQTRLARFGGQLVHFSPKEDVSTANGFQGGERDLMVFVLAYTDALSSGKTWYVTSDENRFIFNVAVSRARACLVVVGDRERAAASGFNPLVRLAREPRARKQRFESPPEKMLHDALVAVGFVPVPQYPLAGRFLDLALPEERLDIEIDGEAYHLGESGERKQSDVYRDMTIQAAGWRVKRFWARQVMADARGCAEEIRSTIRENRG